MAPMLRLEGVSHWYGEHRALGPLDLEVQRGAVGLLGPNGSGKTTLLRVALGLLDPGEGTVRVLGQAPGPALQRRVGYVPEGRALFPDRTGVQGVVYAGRLVGMAKPEATQRAHEVLDYVGLDDERYRDADGYSTGMRARLKLAQALVHDPELLVLDEPTEGIDPEGRLDLLDLLGDLRDDQGLDLVVSTHLLGDIEQLAETAILLDRGEVAARGPLDELRGVDADAFHVKAEGEADELAEALEAAGLDCTLEGSTVRVATDDPGRVLEAARQAGRVVRHLTPEQRGLEDVLADEIATPVGPQGLAGPEDGGGALG